MTIRRRPFLIAVLGPTGSGKSQLALALAQQFKGEIVGCDSVQVYRGLDIGSAKLPAPERCGIPHHLIDVIDLNEELTAGEYSRIARQALAEIRARHHLPVVVGGTGFYLRALLYGLSPAPLRHEELRSRLANTQLSVLHRYLRCHDPAAAGRIHPNDRQKLIRAIELTILSGQPASHVQSRPRDPLQGFAVFKIGLVPDRAALRASLDARAAGMFRSGLLTETEALLSAGVPPGAKPLQSLGYKQAVQVLTNGLPLDEAIRECQTRTRQYAKRQMTWFRAEPDVHWLAGFGTEEAIQQAAIALVPNGDKREVRVGLN